MDREQRNLDIIKDKNKRQTTLLLSSRLGRQLHTNRILMVDEGREAEFTE